MTSYYHLSARLINKRQGFIEGPRSAWDCVEIDHLPQDHWIRRRLGFAEVYTSIQKHLRYCPESLVPWFHNEYHTFA